MDALYFRVSSERQTTENQFEELLQVAEKDNSGRGWNQIRQALCTCIVEEQRPTRNGGTRTVYRVMPESPRNSPTSAYTLSKESPARSGPVAVHCLSR